MTNAMRATEEGDDDWPIYIDKELSLSLNFTGLKTYTHFETLFFCPAHNAIQ